mgnify:CR=1 FL=1|tara:strand:- start:466 stop:1200 length:735 start_codon:yes stop_codon:yes gene_type:complete
MNRKTIVILGATCDLGVELSFIYAKNNFNLILISRNYQKIDNLKNLLMQKFPNISITIYQLNILDLDSQNLVYNKIKDVPDGLISLIGETHQVEKINDKKLINIINVNFTYLINFLSFFLNDFEKKNDGFMICVSSVAGLRGRAKNFIYGSAKAALITFLSGCRNYYNDKNIFIMTVLPGFIKNRNGKKKILENFLQIEPSVLAKKIYLAHKRKKQILYSNIIWRIIMMFIKILPISIFNKIKF